MSLYIKEKAEYFDECMQSMLRQTVLPTEIVIVFDGPISDELRKTVEKYKKQNPGWIKTVENEKRAAAYVPPTGSVAAEIRAAVPPPPTAQELDQRHRRDMEARVNSIIEECKAAAQEGKRKIYVTVESYESFSDKKECEYDINCPEKEKELYDELVKRGFFVSFTKCVSSSRGTFVGFSESGDSYEHHYYVNIGMTVRW